MDKDSRRIRSAWITAAAIVLAAIITGIFYLIPNKSEENTPKTSIIDEKDAVKDKKDAVKKTYLTHPIIKEQSAHELTTYLDSLPPLQRETIFKEHYLGKWVAWSCNVQDVMSSERAGHYNVVCSEAKVSSTWAAIEFSERYNDQIQNLREGDKIFYHARIDDMTPIYFLFSDGELINY